MEKVLDSTNLERNLILTLELLSRNVPLLVVLNLWDEAAHTGIEIDVSRLQELLGVPVIPTVAVTGEGIAELLPISHKMLRLRAEERQRWGKMGYEPDTC